MISVFELSRTSIATLQLNPTLVAESLNVLVGAPVATQFPVITTLVGEMNAVVISVEWADLPFSACTKVKLPDALDVPLLTLRLKLDIPTGGHPPNIPPPLT